eukprot:1229077-Pyramimonas_sp.AAC.1
MGGNPASAGLNHSILAFNPKGEEAEDSTGGVREPGSLRPHDAQELGQQAPRVCGQPAAAAPGCSAIP